MLSYNFSLWHKANTSHLDKRNLIQICGTMFLDMFSLTFLIGYSIYLKNILLPNIDKYQFQFLVSSMVVVCQLVKAYGFYYASSQKKLLFKSPNTSIILIGFCYLLSSLPNYGNIGYFTISYFVIITLVKALIIGYDLGLVLRFAQLNFKPTDGKMIYVFILFIYDLAILAGIFTTRLVIEGEMSLNKLGLFSHLQEFLWFLIALIIAYSRKNITQQMLYFNNYSKLVFIHNLKHYWKKIFTRSLIVSYHVFLIYIVTFRVPSTLHFIFGYSQHQINKILLIMTLLGIIGANCVFLTAKIVKPVQVMAGLFITSILVSLIKLMSTVWMTNKLYYLVTLLFTAFMYGAFLRSTPMVLLPIHDFPPRYKLINRFMAFMLAYTVWGMLAMLILDLSHYIHHTFVDKSLTKLTIFYASICFIAFYRYIKEHWQHD